MNKGELDLKRELIEACEAAGAPHETVVSAARALFGVYGGTTAYIPTGIGSGRAQAELKEILTATSAEYGLAIAEQIMARLGGVPVYFPLETRAFREEIAEEIYTGFDGTKATLQHFVKKYGISFTQAYKLLHEGSAKHKINRQEA